MKILNTKMMKRLANTGVKVVYTRKNGDKRVGQFMSGNFEDSLGKKFYSNLAFVYDRPVGKATFVSKDLHEKDFEVKTLKGNKEALVRLAKNYPNNIVLFETKQGSFVTGRIASGKITTCLGNVYEKDLAFVSFKPFGENCKKDINSKDIWNRNIIVIDMDRDFTPKTIDVQPKEINFERDFERGIQAILMKSGLITLNENESPKNKEQIMPNVTFKRCGKNAIIEDTPKDKSKLTDNDIEKFVELFFKILF